MKVMVINGCGRSPRIISETSSEEYIEQIKNEIMTEAGRCGYTGSISFTVNTVEVREEKPLSKADEDLAKRYSMERNAH